MATANELPPYSDEKFWNDYVGNQAAMTMAAAIERLQALMPPVGHARTISSKHRAIINMHVYTSQYLNYRTRKMTDDQVLRLVETIVRTGIETTPVRKVDGTPVRMYLTAVTCYSSSEAIILVDGINHPLVAKKHYVAHYNTY